MKIISGVIWTFAGGLKGAKEGLEAQKSLDKRIGFVSNNGFITKSAYKKNFDGLGYEIDYENDILQPAVTTVEYLKSIDFQGLIYLLAGDAFREHLEDAGFQCLTMPNHPKVSILRDNMNHFMDVPVESVKAVVYDVDLNFNLTKFYAAQHFLNKSPECLLIYGAVDKIFHWNGEAFAGVGAFMEVLSSQTKQRPIVMGKPGRTVAEIAMRKFHVTDPSKILFIGDTLLQDIEFANENGFQSLLVLSGATTEKMMWKNEEDLKVPKYYTESIADFAELLKQEF